MKLSELHSLGFERTEPAVDGYFTPRCYSCEALVIQGTPCHETGCPEMRVECRECGCMPRRGVGCDCQDAYGDGPGVEP